ncbi:MAG: DUF4390 domain-containing protein [Propionivibrio sp.]
MRCCANPARSFLYGLCGLLWLLAGQAALAAGISLRNPQLVIDDGNYVASADFNINFNGRLEEAVNKGVVLYFSAEFELTRSRWYWFDEQILRRSKTFQLYYHALTRQYRVLTGGLHQSFPTLEEALRVMSRLRNWVVIEKGELRVGQTGMAGLRLRLDLTQMPKTFQVSALSNKDWNLESDWVRWPFANTEAAPVSEAAPSVTGDPPAAEQQDGAR